MPTGITMLNSMADGDFETSLDLQREHGIRALDLKDAVFGKRIMDLTDEEAERAAALAHERGQGVYCLSTGLFLEDVEVGEAEFRRRQAARVTRALELARILEPRFIRLLSASTRRRNELANAVDYASEECGWLFACYREAADRIADSGFEATVENEVGGTLLGSAAEVAGFFEALDRPNVSFTWDVQNLWQMGEFPTLELYRALRPLIGYLHLKGGMAEEPGGPLKWRSTLRDASWPVADIVGAAVDDGVSPVLCLNYPHGEQKPGYDYSEIVWRDLEHVREITGGQSQ